MSAAGPVVLLYHRVGDPDRPSRASRHYVSASLFRRQMALLRSRSFEVVGLEAVARHLRGDLTLSAHHAAITFDDGVQKLYTHSYPVLRDQGYPATIFVITRFLGKPSDYDPPEWDRERLLSESDILEMQAGGITFGSHTRHHARLTECSTGELADEISGSRQDLESLLGRRVESFCYPYGAVNPSVRQAVIDAGYDYACATTKGRNDRGVDPFLIRRINIRADTTLPVFLFKLLRARYFDR